MGQTEKVEKAPKASWFSGLKAKCYGRGELVCSSYLFWL